MMDEVDDNGRGGSGKGSKRGSRMASPEPPPPPPQKKDGERALLKLFLRADT